MLGLPDSVWGVALGSILQFRATPTIGANNLVMGSTLIKPVQSWGGVFVTPSGLINRMDRVDLQEELVTTSSLHMP